MENKELEFEQELAELEEQIRTGLKAGGAGDTELIGATCMCCGCSW
jgi:hypothetical protein